MKATVTELAPNAEALEEGLGNVPLDNAALMARFSSLS
jgi:hypothetical protein